MNECVEQVILPLYVTFGIMSTPNPYQALVTTLHDYSDDDPTVPLADPSTIVPTTNDNPPDDVPICPKPQLIIGTTFIIHGSTEIIRLTNSIDLIDIVEHYDMDLLRDDTFDLIKAKSIHSWYIFHRSFWVKIVRV